MDYLIKRINHFLWGVNMERDYDIRPGDILLTKGEGNWRTFWKGPMHFAQFLIKIGTMSQYCHVGIVLEVEESTITVGEALNQGFTIWESYDYIEQQITKDNMHVYRVPRLGTKQLEIIRREAAGAKGAKYDWGDILDLLLFILTGKTFSFGKPNKFMCSEIIASLFWKAGIEIFPGKTIDMITPADIGRSRIVKREI